MKAGIAGAGIMGQLMAFVLVNAGWEVTMFDNTDGRNCSETAAGLLTPMAELEKCDEVIHRMGLAALTAHWPEIIRLLRADIYFKTSGSLLLAHARDRKDLQRFSAVIAAKLAAGQMPRQLDYTAITSLEAEITRFDEAFYLPDEGQIDSQQLLLVLTKYLNEHDVAFHRQTLVNETAPGCIIASGRKYQYDVVFDCRGLGAKTIFPALRGIRGELVWLHAPDVRITRPIRFLHPRYSLYIVPRPDQCYIIGASEIEAEDTSPISVQTLLELLTAAYAVHPGFSEARLLRTATQCRPTLPHHSPAVQSSNGLIAINGLYRHGFLIAPTLASEVLNYLQRGTSALCYPQLWKAVA
jgi:glycine oxidase